VAKDASKASKASEFTGAANASHHASLVSMASYWSLEAHGYNIPDPKWAARASYASDEIWWRHSGVSMASDESSASEASMASKTSNASLAADAMPWRDP